MKSRQVAADEVVQFHFVVEPEVALAEHYSRTGGDLPDEPLKILELNRGTVPAGVLPVYFGPTGDIPYPTVIIEVTEVEYEAIKNGERGYQLPEGWDAARVIHRPAA